MSRTERAGSGQGSGPGAESGARAEPGAPGAPGAPGVRALHEAVRRAGQRLTPQRMMVLSVLAERGGHMTADEILEWVRTDYPYLNLSTVYRTLDLLVELGMVAETDLGGAVRQFELLGEAPHHHLVCQHCGHTAEIPDEVLKPLRDHLQQVYGFEARMDHFAIFGTCRGCQEHQE